MSFGKPLIIGLVLVSIIFVSFSLVIFQGAFDYGVTVDDTYKDTFDQSSELLMFGNASDTAVQSGQANSGASTDIGFFTGVLYSVKQIFNVGNLGVQFLSATITVFNFPVQIYVLLTTLVFILLLFAFIRLFMKEDF